MNMPNVSPSSATCEAIEKSETKMNRGTKGSDNNDKRICDDDSTDAGQDIHMRKVGTEDGQHEDLVGKEGKNTRQTLESVRATVDMLMTAQEGIRNRRESPEVEGNNQKRAQICCWILAYG